MANDIIMFTKQPLYTCEKRTCFRTLKQVCFYHIAVSSNNLPNISRKVLEDIVDGEEIDKMCAINTAFSCSVFNSSIKLNNTDARLVLCLNRFVLRIKRAFWMVVCNNSEHS